MEQENTITIDDEVINIDTLSEDSKSYLEHLIDLENQIKQLTFKLQQARTNKSAFFTLFTKSREAEVLESI
jgi:hypothetical protein